jgi:hypothetical protein
MRAYSLAHLSDTVLLRDLAVLVARDRATTAALLAHIAEVDARRLYLPAGHPSMHAYCVDELHLSDGATYKRIQVARAARQFPVLFAALAEGRVHLTGLLLLVPHLTPENVDELLGAATHRRKSEIEQFLAVRASAPAMPARVRAIAPPGKSLPRAKSQVAFGLTLNSDELAPGLVDSPPAHENGALPPERYAISVTIARSTHDKLRHAQALLSHAIPSGDIAQVLDRALDCLVDKLEKRRFAATNKPRTPRAKSQSQQPAGARYIPAQVKLAVWQRDRGRCTFVGESGHRCAARRFLEFDHVDPVARGGKATVQGMRLRCRGHNQLEAERVFGLEFMRAKRDAAREIDRADDVVPSSTHVAAASP